MAAMQHVRIEVEWRCQLGERERMKALEVAVVIGRSRSRVNDIIRSSSLSPRPLKCVYHDRNINP